MVDILTLVLVAALAGMLGQKYFRRWRRVHRAKKFLHPDSIFRNVPFGLTLYQEDDGFIVTDLDWSTGEHERLMVMIEPTEKVYARNRQMENVAKLKAVDRS